MSEGRRSFGRRRTVAIVAITVVAAFAIGYWVGVARDSGHDHAAPGATTAAAVARPGVVDVGFCQDMTRHHKQAVLMAIMALDRATPTVRTLAKEILSSQSREIGVMSGWLALWGKPQGSSAPMAWMSHGDGARISGVDKKATSAMPSHIHMPGMATTQQLGALRRKAGKRFDVLFMQLMTRHHQSGIVMARYAEQHANTEIVRHAARAMVFEQAHDIVYMKAMLKVDHAEPLSPPAGFTELVRRTR